MSSTVPSSQVPAGYSSISEINFTGGFPTSKDLAPSILFLVLYILTIPIYVWRIVRPQDRCLVLIRPGVFLACRIGMLVLRAVMSKSTYGSGELIAELVLVSVGYLFLIEPCVELWRRNLSSAISKQDYPSRVRRLALLMRISLLAAIGITIAGSALVSSAISNPNQLDTVKALREAGYVLSLAVVGVLLVALVFTHVEYGLAIVKTGYILLPACCLVIVGVYRVIQVFTNNASAPVRSDTAFWILQITFEFIAYCSLLAISVPTWYPQNGGNTSATGGSQGDVELANKPGSSGVQNNY